jgi:hypothetical protein
MKAMNIFEMIKDGLRIARTSKSLWLYGFFVGLGSAVNNGSKDHGSGTPALPHAFTAGTALLAVVVVVLIAAGVFMYFVSEGALIEGVRRLRGAKPTTVREGWRDGVAHWSVLFRIALIYFATTAGSVLVLAAPALLALQVSGTAVAIVLAIPGVLIAVPWLVTLYMWQAFASRIAVIENRHARDAIAKARLFLHGRVLHGLKLIVAALLGRMIVMLVGAIGLGTVALVVIAVLKIFGTTQVAAPVIALAAMTLLPIAFIVIAFSGTTLSSIWTIGYLTQEGK